MHAPRLPLRADRAVYEFELKHPLIDAAEALSRFDAGTHLFVDARELDLSVADHVPGALSLRPSRFTMT